MLAVRLTPKGGRDAIDGIETGADGRPVLRVRVRAAASEGEANDALTRLIAKSVGVAPRAVCLISGHTSRLKRLKIDGSAVALAAALETICRQGSGLRPMTARIIDGKTIAAELRGRVADAAHRLARDRGLVPGLAVVLVGSNPASEIYVGSKTKATVGSGMRSFDHRLPATVSEADLLTLIGRLNKDPVVHGILVQLPLPAHIDAQKTSPPSIRPRMWTDSIPVNIGRLALAGSLRALAPCTPLGCIILAKTVRPSLEGLEAVVIGRSNVVGKPLAQLLLAENATVTIAHSKTEDLPGGVPARRSRVRGGRPAGDGAQGLDQAGRDGDRRGHQPHAGRGRQDRAGRRCCLCGSVGSGGRDHAGSGWRRTDDDFLPARQLRARGMHAGGIAVAGVRAGIGYGLTDDRCRIVKNRRRMSES